MRTGLFLKNRIKSEKISSQKGASVVFALVGFMFAAMIAFVVINAAFSAATRIQKLKNDEQAFLLAQSMSGIILEALSGNGKTVLLPDRITPVSSPDTADKMLKYDALTVSYQYIEQKDPVDASIVHRYFNAPTDSNPYDNMFTLYTIGASDKPTYSIINGKGREKIAEDGSSIQAIQTLIFNMAKKIDQGASESVETIKTTDNSGQFEVTTVFRMNKSYLLNAYVTALVKSSSGSTLSQYHVNIEANAIVRRDNLICVGTKNVDGDAITAKFNDNTVDAANEEPVKVTVYSVSWPADQLKSVYEEAP